MFVSIKINYLESNTAKKKIFFNFLYFASAFPKVEQNFEKLNISDPLTEDP